MNITCTIPTIPYLGKFLYWKERRDQGETLDLNNTLGDLGYVLSGILVGKQRVEYFTKEDLPDNYTFDVRFVISPRKMNYGRIILSANAIMYFNNYLRKNLNELLLDRVLQGKHQGIKEKDTIYAFITELGIEDDVTFANLQKAQQRLRKRKKLPQFHHHK